MRHHATGRFWQLHSGLPPQVQELADRSFRLLTQDPYHPSLHFKRVGRFWSARVGAHHRALAVEQAEDLVWFWIGHHDAYDKMIRQA